MLTHGLHYGTGVFEGERAYETAHGPAIFRHRDHLARLLQLRRALLHAGPVHARGAADRHARADRRQRLALSATSARSSSAATGRWGCIRSTATVDVSIAAWPWGAYLGEEAKQPGIRAKVSSWRRISSDSLIPHAKAHRPVPQQRAGQDRGAPRPATRRRSCSTATGTSARARARTSSSFATDGSTRRRQTAAILDGINRKSVIQIARDLGYEVVERDLARAELVPGRRGLPDRHRGRAGAGARDRRPRDRDGERSPGRGHPRAAAGRSTRAAARRRSPLRGVAGRGRAQQCAGQPAGRSLRGLRSRPMSADRALRRHPARRHAGRGHVAVRRGEAARCAPARRARHRPDRGRLPELEPQGARAVRAAGRRDVRARRDRRLRHDPPPGFHAPTRDPALRILADCFAPVCTLVGKTWSLHLEKVVRVDREENLRMIAESVAFLVGEGKRVIYDAEHFFDGFARRSRLRPARACAPPPRPAPTRSSAVTPTAARCPHGISRGDGRGRGRAGPGSGSGIHCHDDAGCGVANSLAAVAAGATHVQGTINGYGERCGNANLVSIIPNLQLKLGLRCVSDAQLAELTSTATYVAELLNFTPDPDAPYVGRNAFAHKGGMHVAGVNADPATFEHIDPEIVGNRREMLISELSGKGTVLSRAQDAGISLTDAVAAEVVERVKAARARRLSLRGRRRLLRAAAAQGDRRVRAAVPAGVLARDRREARRRPGRDRGDDQDLGRRRALRAHRRGQRPGQRPGPRAARGAGGDPSRTWPTSSWSTSRSASSTRPRARVRSPACCSTSPTGPVCWGSIGVSENVIEASWEALVDSLEYGMQPGSRHAGGSAAGAGAAPAGDPGAPAAGS